MDKKFQTWFSLNIFANFMKKKPSTESYGIFDYLSQTYEITKFQMIKLRLDVGDVMHTDGIYADHVLLLDFLLTAILFCDDKGSF